MQLQHLQELNAARDGEAWNRWARRALLLVAGLHLSAGVVFFFAYNWEDLPAFAKFGLLEAGIVLSTVVAFVAKSRPLLREAGLFAACLFTGVLFAVIGQVYQTGADAWELFATWAVLIIPWTLASRSSLVWMLWSVVSLVAIFAYTGQRLLALELINAEQLAAGSALLLLAWLAGFELASRRGVSWLHIDRIREAFLIAAGIALFGPVFEWIMTQDRYGANVLLYLVIKAGWIMVYRQVIPGFPPLVIAVVSISLLTMTAGGRLLFESFENADSAIGVSVLLMITGVWCAFVTRIAIGVLRRWRADMEGVSDE